MSLDKFYSRPPTKRMIDKLKECLEKENQKIKVPCMADEMKSSLAGLYKRGLIETRMETVNSKRLLCIYVTDMGRQFLQALTRNNFPGIERN